MSELPIFAQNPFYDAKRRRSAGSFEDHALHAGLEYSYRTRSPLLVLLRLSARARMHMRYCRPYPSEFPATHRSFHFSCLHQTVLSVISVLVVFGNPECSRREDNAAPNAALRHLRGCRIFRVRIYSYSFRPLGFDLLSLCACISGRIHLPAHMRNLVRPSLFQSSVGRSVQ